jgi:hypothetical protein
MDNDNLSESKNLGSGLDFPGAPLALCFCFSRTRESYRRGEFLIVVAGYGIQLFIKRKGRK